MAIVNQNIVIEITADVETRTGTGNNGPYEISSQEAYYHSPEEKYPRLISFNVESEQKSYPLGHYLLDTSKSLQVGQYNALGFNRYMNLIPLNESDLEALRKNQVIKF